MAKVVLLTGGSSGIGYQTAIKLAKEGYIVYSAARRLEKMAGLKKFGIHPIFLDITDEKSIKESVLLVMENEGKIDVLINNAGYGSFGALEDVALEEARRQFEVNVFGLIRLTQEILPYMRKQKAGRIINISSVGGRITTFMGGWYHATKYALEALSDALRMEVKSFGIDVVLVEPGSVKTPWNDIMCRHLLEASQEGAYSIKARQLADNIPKLYHSSLFSDPDVIANTIAKTVKVKRVKPRYLTGRGAKLLFFLHTILPTRLFDWLIVKSLT